MKRLISVLLAAVLAAGLLTPALAATPSFSDVSDPELSARVDSLRMLGVVAGDTAGTFRPNSTLTRAEFCVMAVNAMGNAGQVALYSTRTIFPDVRSDHWARGYINLAAAGETKIIAGTDQGVFEPDSPITYGQAVTILIRILGYTDEDTGMLWPDGFIALAEKIGLADGLSGLGGSAPITRGQAATLFCNLLTTEQKEGGLYAAELGTIQQNAVILALDVETADGEDGIRAVTGTATGVYAVANGVIPQSILGRKGDLLTNSRGEILTFLPDRSQQKTVVVRESNAGWLIDSAGTRYSIAPDTDAYTSEGRTTYEKVFADLGPGSMATLYLSGGTVTGVYVSGGTATEAVVVSGAASTATFAKLTNGATNYKIYKNGQEIGFGDIQPYDVATYDNGVLRVSDLRITVLYENAAPNETYPTSITAFGKPFEVLSTAVDSASRFRIGNTVTLLLTADGKVAGVESPNTVRGNAVGVVTEGTASTATVELLGGSLTFEVTTSSDASKLEGQLVNLSSYQVGKVSLSRITGGSPSGSFDVARRTVGTVPVSAGASLYERAGTTGKLHPLTFRDLEGISSVPASQIAYYHTNAARQVDILVLKDVTGDAYEYGFLEQGQRSAGSWDGETIYNRTVSVRNKANQNPGETDGWITGYAFKDGQPGGAAEGLDGKAAGIVTLNELKDVRRSDFYTHEGETFLNHGGKVYRVAEEVQCYNQRAKSWFDDLASARAFSDDLTVYYDSMGGKIRLVVAK